MLANLLPGLRDLRAPLAAGYLWLVALYVAFEPMAPDRDHARGIWLSLIHLEDKFSVVGTGVAVSFVAYLLGSISEAIVAVVPELPMRSLSSSRYGDKGAAALRDVSQSRVDSLRDALGHGNPPRTLVDAFAMLRLDDVEPKDARWFRQVAPLLERAEDSVFSLMEAAHKSAEGANHPPDMSVEEDLSGELLAIGLTDAIVDELGLVRTRMLGKEPELFSEVDRMRAEAEFRFAISPALAGLAGVLAWRATWWSATIAAGAALILALSARARTKRANDALLEALRIGRAQAAPLERIDAAVAQLTGEPSKSP